MIISPTITYYLIAGLAVATIISGFYEFLLPNKSELKTPAVEPLRDEGTHRALEAKNEY